jgi:hypothetical protein
MMSHNSNHSDKINSKKKAKSVGKEGRPPHSQRRKKNLNNPPQISSFDKLEEARYKSYEAGQTLSQLCDLINC